MIGLMVGSGMEGLRPQDAKEVTITTPFGAAYLVRGTLSGKPVCICPRHGRNHEYAPHQVPSRAQLWAMKEAGVSKIFATATVGGLHADVAPGHYAVPDQIIDYTTGRESTFWGYEPFGRDHVDFTNPFDEGQRTALLNAAREVKIFVSPKGCYGCTQGPRLETAAEIRRMVMDGCEMVGMTAMPEAALARELQIPYGIIAASVNWGAGLAGEKALDFETIKATMKKVATGLTTILLKAIEMEKGDK